MLSLEKHIMECSRSQAAIFCYLRQAILSLSPHVKEEIRTNGARYTCKGTEYSVKNVPTGVVLYIKERTANAFNNRQDKTFHFASTREIDAETLISSLTGATNAQAEYVNFTG